MPGKQSATVRTSLPVRVASTCSKYAVTLSPSSPTHVTHPHSLTLCGIDLREGVAGIPMALDLALS